MFTYSDKKSLIISIIAAIAVVAMIVLQFLPCWAYNTETGDLYDDAEVLTVDRAVDRAKEDAYNAIKEVVDEAVEAEAAAVTAEAAATAARSQATSTNAAAIAALATLEAEMEAAAAKAQGLEVEAPETTETQAEATETEAEATEAEATETEAEATEAEVTETEAEATETEATETEAEATETEATETEAEATETEATETEAEATETEAAKTETVEKVKAMADYERTVIDVSVQGYTWMVTHHKTLTNHFEDAVDAEAKAAGLGRGEYEEFAPTQFVGLPILTLVAGVIAVYFGLRRSDNPLLCGLATCISAGANIVMALTQKLLTLGFNTERMLIAGCVAAVLGLYLVIMAIAMFVKKAKSRRAPISPAI